jgi:hypothetical protein
MMMCTLFGIEQECKVIGLITLHFNAEARKWRSSINATFDLHGP